MNEAGYESLRKEEPMGERHYMSARRQARSAGTYTFRADSSVTWTNQLDRHHRDRSSLPVL